MALDIFTSCNICPVVYNWGSHSQLMPFCTVAACFQECEPKSASQQKKKCLQCLWMRLLGSLLCKPPLPHPFHTSILVLRCVHGLLSTDTSDVNSGVTLSTALLWRQYCSCVSICLFYSLVSCVILHSNDLLSWLPPKTNGGKLWV